MATDAETLKQQMAVSSTDMQPEAEVPTDGIQTENGVALEHNNTPNGHVEDPEMAPTEKEKETSEDCDETPAKKARISEEHEEEAAAAVPEVTDKPEADQLPVIEDPADVPKESVAPEAHTTDKVPPVPIESGEGVSAENSRDSADTNEDSHDAPSSEDGGAPPDPTEDVQEEDSKDGE